MSGAAASGAAAAAAAMIQAVRASGVIVTLEAGEFAFLLSRQAEPLVVHAEAGVFSTKYCYLMSYKGLAFYTKSAEPLTMPAEAEVIRAKSIWVP